MEGSSALMSVSMFEEHDGAPQLPLIGLLRKEIAEALSSFGIDQKQINMRVSQIWHWLYYRGITSMHDASNISKDVKELVDSRFSISRPEIVSEQISVDGTRKWLLRFKSRLLRPELGLAAIENSSSKAHSTQPMYVSKYPQAGSVEVETVYIPDERRGTLCISSQVGCPLRCSFCRTGTQSFVRNLTSEEMLLQIMAAKERLAETNPLINLSNRHITNIVLMGMGEPLLNFEMVKKALLIANDPEGLSFSKRRMTLSTAGVVPMIGKLGEETGIMLAISLHAVRDDLRDQLVPLNRKYKIAELLEACRNYPGLSNAKRITFEYVMLKGVNDSASDARELVRLLKNIPSKINIIPFNPWPGSKYECSSWDTIGAFSSILKRAGYSSPVRFPRGRDILAACGQLRSDTIKTCS